MSNPIRARSLKEAYRKLTPNPLDSQEELDMYYAKTDEPQNSRLAHLRVALESRISTETTEPFVPTETTKWILGGTRGNGKSTELHYQMTLIQDNYLPIYLDVERELDIIDIEPLDLLILIGTRVYQEALKQNLRIKKTLLQELYEHVVRYRGGPDAEKLENIKDGDTEGSISAKLNLVLTEFTVQLSKTFSKRTELRADILNDQSSLLTQFNALFREVASQIAPKSLLVVVDGLDKLSPDHGKSFFFESRTSRTLQLIDCNAIYTIPISLMYGQDYQAICKQFDDYEISMPNIKIKTRSGAPNEQGRDLLKRMIWKRMDEAEGLIAPDALEQLVELSGGLPRELFYLAREACTYALVAGEAQIQLPHVDRAAVNYRNRFSRMLTREDKEALRAIASGNNEVEKSDLNDRLMHMVALLEYRNDGNWFDVHPVVRPLVNS